MWSTEDEWTLFRLDRELDRDKDVRRAFEALDGTRRARVRRRVVTVFGVVTALAVIAAGEATNRLGVLVLLLVVTAVGDSHWRAARCRARDAVRSAEPI